MEFKPEPNKLDKARNQKILQDTFLSTLSAGFAIHNNLTIAEHLRGILRSKGATDTNPKNPDASYIVPFKWTDEKLVRAAEKYFDELEQDPPYLWNSGEDFLTEDDLLNFHERNSSGS